MFDKVTHVTRKRASHRRGSAWIRCAQTFLMCAATQSTPLMLESAQLFVAKQLYRTAVRAEVGSKNPQQCMQRVKSKKSVRIVLYVVVFVPSSVLYRLVVEGALI